VLAGVCAVSAWAGALGMAAGFLILGDSVSARLPFHSPVFGAVALAMVVAAPTSAAAILVWRAHPRAGSAISLAGLLLVGWIGVEVLVTGQFSWLQPVCAAAGLAMMLLGDRAVVRQFAEVLWAAPLFVVAPLLRPWHLRWGATPGEVAAPMPGDGLVRASHFTATRAITIDAPPEAVWPWLVQVGFGRAGFYSYDLLDNLAHPSAERILPAWQQPRIGDIAAPMTNPPRANTSFRIVNVEPPSDLLWSKQDSTWSWVLRPLPGNRTRLVTRLRQQYRWAPATIVTVLLAEFGDFPMMRRMLHGIKQRAERAAAVATSATSSPMRTPSRPAASWIDLYWIPLGAGNRLVQLNGHLYEALLARRLHRAPQRLYHAALEVVDHGSRYSIEMAPAWKDNAPERGVVCEGPVGLRPLGRLRAFRYEVRCWHDGRVPDLAFAVDSPRRISASPVAVTRLLTLIRKVPTLTWGLDEAHTGEMWNSNSLIAWLLAGIGQPAATIDPPMHGRAPGWNAGLTLAARQAAHPILGTQARQALLRSPSVNRR
jgi:hypothetical protein